MSPLQTQRWTLADYDRAADRYARQLPLEQRTMEAMSQSTQRRITLASMELLKEYVRELEVYNELLVQYFYQGQLRQVVPDNMLRRSRAPLVTSTSYVCELEPVRPFLVLEYVSPSSYRKDHKDSFQKYEQELAVPYYLLFYPEKQELLLYRHNQLEYERVTDNEAGRLEVPELYLEVALLEGWVRYWFRGELLPLPAELLQQLQKERRRAEQAEQRLGRAEAEIARLQKLLETTRTGSPESTAEQP